MDENTGNYARAVAVVTRCEMVGAQLAMARAEMSVIVGEHHAATEALARALLEARKALNHAQLVLKRVPR